MSRSGIARRAGRGSKVGLGVLVASVAVGFALASTAAAKIVTDPVTGHRFGIVPVFHGSTSLNASPPLNGARALSRTAAAGTPTCDPQVDAQCATTMIYHNGPVQHGENIVLFFWDPSGFAGAPGYVAGMQGWVNDLAAGSFTPGNVAGVQAGNPVSVTQEYYDMSGPGSTKNFVSYAVHNGGTVIDTDAYPTSGCTDSYTNASGQTVTLPVCLTAGQLYTELSSYVQSHNLPVGLGTEYFLLTPQGVGTCDDGASTSCAFSTYCGWHTAFGSPADPLLFADMPWQAGTPGCDLTGTASLHTTGIDPVVNTFSHELAETMTDPEENAWYGQGGGSDEIGDKCAYQFSVGEPAVDPTGLPHVGDAYYNTTLNGHDYLLQMEYDNRAGGCNQWDTDTQPTAVLSGPSQVSVGAPATFSLSNVSAPAGIAYVIWYFGDGAASRVAGGGSVQHSYSSVGSRTVTAVLTDNHGNELRLSKSLTVASGGRNSVIAHPPAHARAGRPYSIKLSGHAVGAESLYVFLDYRGCGATPAIEHARANGFIWAVEGNFSEIGRGKSPRAGHNHVCAYLVRRSAPKNPNAGVLAHDFVTFTIHH